MHDSALNIAECFRWSLLVYEWWGILQVSQFLNMFKNQKFRTDMLKLQAREEHFEFIVIVIARMD